MTLVKICGIHDLTTIPVLNALHPDLVGFVFAPSKRQVSRRQAQQLRQALDLSILTVGVFVNESINDMLQILHDSSISYIQLHCQEDAHKIQTLRKAGAKVIQVRHQLTDQQPTAADILLYDNSAGRGQQLAWQPLPNHQQPQFLAGGLTPDNVQSALQITHADGVDVSSGVETDGSKDPTKIEQFITNVKEMEDFQ